MAVDLTRIPILPGQAELQTVDQLAVLEVTADGNPRGNDVFALGGKPGPTGRHSQSTPPLAVPPLRRGSAAPYNPPTGSHNAA